MASPPKHPATPPRPPAATPRPPAAPTHATAPPAPKPAPAPEPPKAEHKPEHREPKVDVDSLTLSATVHTCIARLAAGRAEAKAWEHNLQQALATDVASGALSEAEAKAVAAKYEVKLPS